MSGGSKKGAKDIPTEGTSLESPITAYKRLVGTYPSNTQIWWAYKRPLELGTQEPPKNYIEVFDPQLRHQIASGNSPAPKGHYILEAFHQDRSDVSGIPGIPLKTSNGFRPKTVAFFAGRVFYAGVNTSGYNTRVYFSQILERPEQIQFCYQQQDPSAEDLRDLLPSDGGVIVIPEVAEINHIFVMGESLFIGCNNGVWQVTGSQGTGFKANDYAVSKISGTPVISSMSFVFVEGVPLWWNRSGIYTLQTQDNGAVAVTSLSEETIKQFYDLIPASSKFYAKGSYDPLLKKVQWLYRSTETETNLDISRYDKILNLDTRTGAFYPYATAEAGRVELLGIFDVEGYSVEQEQLRVLVGDDEVYVNTDKVFVLHEFRKPVQSKFKYIVNVLDDTTGTTIPPDAPSPSALNVLAGEDDVKTGSDNVVYTPL